MKTRIEVRSATSDLAFPRLQLFNDSTAEFVNLTFGVVSFFTVSVCRPD